MSRWPDWNDRGFFAIMALMVVLTGCSPQFRYVCPSLSPVPSSTLDALETQSRKDRDTGPWVVDLSKHYQKCDEVNKHGGLL